MSKYVLKRLLIMIPTLIAVGIIMFTLSLRLALVLILLLKLR